MLFIEFKRRVFIFLIFMLILTGSQVFTYFGRDFIISMAYVGNNGISELDINSNRLNFLKNSFEHIIEGDNNYYLWFNWISKSLIQVFLVMSVFLGYFDLIIDRNKGNIYFTLNTTSRKKYYLSKTVASTFYLLLSILLSYIIGIVLAFNFNYNINILNYTYAHLQILLSGILVYSLMLFLSLIIKREKVAKVVLPIIIFTIIIMFSNITASKNIFYEFVIAKDIIIKNQLNLPIYFTSIILSIILYLNSYIIFKKSDL